MGCCDCTRENCAVRRPIRTRDDVSCCCRFFCPVCAVYGVDGCGQSLAIVSIFELATSKSLGWIYTMCCWEPRPDPIRHVHVRGVTKKPAYMVSTDGTQTLVVHETAIPTRN